MGTGTAHRRLFGGYLVASLTAAAAHGFLPPGARPVSYLLIAGTTVPAMVYGSRRCPPHGRATGRLLLLALVVLTAGNLAAAAAALADDRLSPVAETLVTLGHVGLLASALSFVRLRGRNDAGGLLDSAVVSLAFCGLLWTALLQPRLGDIGSPVGVQVGLLVNFLVLGGVLGALVRLAGTTRQPILALRLVISALLLALVGNASLVTQTGSLTSDRPPAVEVVFLVSYALIGAMGLHPSLHDLATPGPAPADRLTRGRLAFLGAALAVPTLAGAGRQLLGLPVDGLLLAAGALTTVPLVMLRVGHLSTKRAQAEAELVRQATHDPLTGLVNRAEVLTRLEAALARRAADGRLDVLVLFCDLDGFKSVNDRLGHAVGDDLLVSVARRLARTVSHEDTLARYGGDEFLVLCQTADPAAARTSLTRRVIGALADPFDLAGERITIGVSVGAVTAGASATADSVIRDADAAMYAAKQRQRGRHLRSA